jgi:hypothetical protein
VDGDLGGSLTAKSLGSVSVKGNMDGAEITLSQVPDLKLKALGKIAVKGWLKNSSIRTAGNITSVAVGGMENATIFAGVKDGALADANDDGVWDLLNPDADLKLDPAGRATIGSLKVSGMKEPDQQQKMQWVDSFFNSNVAAAQIGSLNLLRPAFDDGTAFGVAADAITKCTVKFNDVAEPQWKQGDLFDPGTKSKGHFEIRLV